MLPLIVFALYFLFGTTEWCGTLARVDFFGSPMGLNSWNMTFCKIVLRDIERNWGAQTNGAKVVFSHRFTNISSCRVAEKNLQTLHLPLCEQQKNTTGVFGKEL